MDIASRKLCRSESRNQSNWNRFYHLSLFTEWPYVPASKNSNGKNMKMLLNCHRFWSDWSRNIRLNHDKQGRVRVMVLKITFNNISAIFWWSVVLVEEIWVPRENHRPSASHLHTLSHRLCCIMYTSPKKYTKVYTL